MKLTTTLLSLSAALSAVTAFSAKTFRSGSGPSNIEDLKNSFAITGPNSQQVPLTSPESTSPGQTSTGSTSLEVEGWWIFGIPAYITPIAVGTPNQVFRTHLELEFPGLLVRDIACLANENFGCGVGGDLGFVYNGSASSTHEDGDESFYFMLPAHNVYGNVSRDDVKLVSFGLENVTLGAVDRFHGENYYLMILSDISDGALGLAPPNATASVPYSKHPTRNILSHLLEDTSIANPIISFSLPPYGVERGAITLGSLPSGHEDVDVSIPLGDLSSGWNLPLNSLTLASTDKNHKDKDITLDASNLALYPTFTSDLTFPHNMTQTLYKHLHALPESRFDDVMEFNCSYRGKLPDLSFDFNEASIAFREAEYTLHGYYGDEELCLLNIVEHWQPGMEGVVAIGSQLWEKWHVVFDLGGEGSVGLIEREDWEGPDGVTEERGKARIGGLRWREKGA